MSMECVFCHSPYVNYLNHCLECGRTQHKTTRATKATRAPSQKRRKLTKQMLDNLKQDIQRNLEAGTLNMAELGRKYAVDRKTVAYWKKKIELKA